MSWNPQEEAFITAELEEFRTYLVQQAKAAIVRRDIKVDEDLLQSVSADVLTTELLLKFMDHGRMHDMGAGNAYRKGVYVGNRTRTHLLKGRKPSKWYSRLAYGSVYGTLVNNLSNKYIAAVPGELKKAFEKG